MSTEKDQNTNRGTVNGTTGYSSSQFGSSKRTSYNQNEKPAGAEQSIHIDNKKERFAYSKEVARESARFVRSVYGAVATTALDVARSEESGTMRQVDNLNDARHIASDAMRAAVDAPRQISNTFKSVANAGTAVANVGRYLMGNETREFRSLSTERSLKKEEKSSLTSEDRGSLSRSEQKYAVMSEGRLSSEINKLKIENSVLEKKEASLRSSGKGTAEQYAAIKEAKKHNLKKINTLEKVRQTKEQAQGNYGDVSKIKNSARAERIIKRTEKKISKVQREEAGGRINYNKIHSMQSKVDRQDQAFARVRAKASRVKAEINTLQYKKDLSPKEALRLEELKSEKERLQGILRDRSLNTKALKGKMNGVGRMSSRDSLLSSADKSRLQLLREKINRNKAHDRMQKGKQGRKGLTDSLGRAVSKAAQESEENSVQGVMKASRFVQNRYVRGALKHFVSITTFPVRIIGKKVVAPVGVKLVKSVDSKLGVSTAIHTAEANAKTKILHSKPAAKVRNVSKKVRRLPKKATSFVKKKLNNIPAVNKITDQYTRVINSKPVKNVSGALSKVKGGVKKARGLTKKASAVAQKASEAISKVLSAVKGFVMKAALIVAGILLLISVVGALLTAAGGAAGSLLTKDDSSNITEAGQVDVAPDIKELIKIQEEWNSEINSVIKDNESDYDKIKITVYSSASQNVKESFMQIITMSYICANTEAQNLYAAYEHLFHETYSYSLIESDYYSCDGCMTETVECEGCEQHITYCEGCVAASPDTEEPDPDPIESETETIELEASETEPGEATDPEGDISNESIPEGAEDTSSENETEVMTCPGHEERSCPGHEIVCCHGEHQDLKVVVRAVSVEKLYELANEYFNSNSVSFQYSEKFKGWDKESIAWVELILQNVNDEVYEGLHLLEDLEIFRRE